MRTETPTDELLETDPVKLSAALRPVLQRACISTCEGMPWGSIPELKALGKRAWRNEEEMVLMILSDWLAMAERNPDMFDRVFGAGPGSLPLARKGA